MRKLAEPPAWTASSSLLCAGLVMLTPAANPTRALAAVLLVFLLPGVAMLGASGLSTPSGLIERLVWQVGLGISTAIVATITLYGLGFRLGLTSWTVALTTITLLASLVWMLKSSRAAPTSVPVRLRARRLPTGRATLVFAVTVALLAAAAAITATSVTRTTSATHFTQLWLLPSGDAGGTAQVGIYNHEGTRQDYVVEVLKGNRLVRRLPAVTVGVARRWTKRLPLPSGSGRLTVAIRRGSPTAPVYREAYLWLPATRTPKPLDARVARTHRPKRHSRSKHGLSKSAT